MSAQIAYEAAAGSYGTVDCLMAPAARGCILGYAATAPTFLDESIGSLATKTGYERTFVPGEARPAPFNPNGIATFCYSAVPSTAGQTGVRSFAADHTGRICVEPDGADLCAGPSLPPDCEVLR